MIRVQSLGKLIVFQFAVILLPLIALLAYQTFAEARRTDQVKQLFGWHEQALQVREQYGRFVNGAVDAVDTGNLGAGAREALQTASDKMRALSAATSAPELSGVSRKLSELNQALLHHPTAEQLKASRAAIGALSVLTGQTQDAQSAALDGAIRRAIDDSQRGRKIVAAAAFALLALTLWFIYRMIKGLSAPLSAAVQVADGIAEGRPVAIDTSASGDIGNLLASLRRMQHSLVGYRDRMAEYQRGLEDKIKQLAQSQSSLADAQRLARLGNWYWEGNSELAYWSDEMRRMVGTSAQSTPTLRAFLMALDPRERESIREEFAALRKEPRRFALEHSLVALDQGKRVVFHQGASEADEHGRVVRLYGTMQDITERKQAEEQIRMLAFYDGLTGLPNRRYFREALEHALARARRNQQGLAAMFIDVDRFKRINDTLGHPTGDALLQEAARRLRCCIRQSDVASREADQPDGVLARLGGDEFTVTLVDLKHPQDAAKVAARILSELAKPFDIHGRELSITVSIGIAIYPDNGEDADTLLKHADAAMYQAKAAGKNNYQFFAEEMNAAALERLTLENELKQALGREQFVLHYQPKVDSETHAVQGVEALIRWQHPRLGRVAPGVFIPMAEEAGLIVPIGEWVLRTACAQIAAWRSAGLRAIPVAVNLATPSFRSPDLVEQVSGALKTYDLAPHLLELEITESMLMQDVQVATETMARLHELGVKISIDDFGTGHSSLGYLTRFRFDQIKIDRSFVVDIAIDPASAVVSELVISLGRSLRLSVVAEGVETAEQAEVLRKQGCELMQGYFFGAPMPAEQLAERLRK